MSLGSVLPGCVSSAASCMSVARWLFKTCAVVLEQTGLSPACTPPRGCRGSLHGLFSEGAGFIFPGFTERSAGGKLKQNDLLFLGQRLTCERKDETPLVGS